MKEILSIKEIINSYDNFIIDQWGVMHNGSIGYKYAIETINLLNEKNKNLFIISNSSKRQSSSYEKLPSYGYRKESFKNILTSGEMIWSYLHNKHLNDINKKKCLHIFDASKEDGLDFRNGLNLDYTDDIENAELILACTPFIEMEPIDYIPMLNIALQKNLIMYCANPDFETVEMGSNNNIFCMGAVAEIYNKMGGRVIIKGKPEKDIYIETTKSFDIDKKRTLAIGDSLFHDIKGANNFSIDSVLVKSGIHKENDIIDKLIKNHQILPTYSINKFKI